MRLIHDHQRIVDVHQVGKGKPDIALERPIIIALKPRSSGGYLGKMRLQHFMVGIDLAPVGVGHFQGLHRADKHAQL